MTTDLQTLITEIQGILQDSAYTDDVLIPKINRAVADIAGGIRMPDGQVSPPLPDLYQYDTVTTSTTAAYVSLPTSYQRNVFNILDSSGCRIAPPQGGDYYAFNRFLRCISDMRLTEAGSVYRVAVKGTKLYYQGIPAAAETIGVHFYRKPVDMVADADTPDGIPDHLQLRLIKHYVIMTIYGDKLEAGVTEPAVGFKHHAGKFFEAMTDLVDFIGIDAEAQYYGEDGYEDGGVCD